MQRPSRSLSLALVAVGLAALLGCERTSSSRSCAANAECPAGSRCASGACVANGPPSAVLSLPPEPQANVLLSFDASASADPDAGDSVASFAWVFRALTAACAPPAVAGTGPVATVRFGCPGRYAVDVTAADRMGAASTASAELDVAAHAGPALVTVGPDLATDHACAGTPPRCGNVASIALSASAPGLAPDEVAFAWTVEPPADRALTPSRRVTFSPSAAVAEPAVTIETDGEAISGDWVFRVEARDAAGVIGTGATRVSVLNGAPVIALVGAVPVPDHAFDGTQLTASGEVLYTVSDPDGDPLSAPVLEYRHTGDGPSSFTGGPRVGPQGATFSIVVPYAAPEDSGRLIGDVDRTIVLAIIDVNGAQDVESWPILVGNRAPTPTSTLPFVSVNHTYDAASARYVADATVAAWTDPDQDPLFPGGPTGDAACASYDLLLGSVVVRCSAPYPGAPSLSGILGTRLVSTAARDPWTAGPAATTLVEVLNRPPRLTATSVTRNVACIVGGCCRRNADGECVDEFKTLPDEVIDFGGLLADDDGDPLTVVVDGSPSAPCVAASCRVSGRVARRGPFCGTGFATDTWTVGATDGAATASGTLTVTRRCL